jgi:hypothetical protein
LAPAALRGNAGTISRRPERLAVSGDQAEAEAEADAEAVIVIVIVIVIAPLVVAALVNGNEAVIVIDTVDDQGSTNHVTMATMGSSNSTLAQSRHRSTRPLAWPLGCRSRMRCAKASNCIERWYTEVLGGGA